MTETTWAFNAATLAASEYRGFGFDSMAVHQGHALGVRPDGIYTLDGEDDDGVPIDALVRTGLTDFGSPGRKAIRKAYLYVKSDNLVYLKAVHDNGGERSEVWYQLAASTSDPLQRRRVDLGRGAKGVRWAFEVTNVDGGVLDLRGLEVVPVVLARRYC